MNSINEEIDATIGRLAIVTHQQGCANGQLAAIMGCAVIVKDPAADECRLHMLKQLIKRREEYIVGVKEITNVLETELDRLDQQVGG